MASLRRYTRSLAMVISVLPNPIFIIDPQLQIRYLNESAVNFLGGSEGSILHQPITDFVSNSSKQILLRSAQSLMKDVSGIEGRSRELTLTICLASGTETPMNAVLTQVIADDGAMHVLVWLGLLRAGDSLEDISVRRLEAAREGIEFINALDLIDDSVIILDNDWRYQFINQAGLGALKCKRSDILGKNVWELRPDLKNTVWKRAAHEAKKAQQLVQIEEYYPRSQRWYATKFIPTPNSMVAQIKDITELKYTQEMNKQLTGSLSQAMEIYWDKRNAGRRNRANSTEDLV